MPGTSKTETARLEKQFRHSRVLTDFEFYKYGKHVELKKKFCLLRLDLPREENLFSENL